MKVTKQELIDRIAEATGSTKKDTGAILEALEEVVTESLEDGHEVALVGGVLYPKYMQAREGVRPGTTERIQIPAKVSVGFRAGAHLKETVNLLKP